jgi:hypothetical protein
MDLQFLSDNLLSKTRWKGCVSSKEGYYKDIKQQDRRPDDIVVKGS